jgi:exonuclease SbcD
MKFLHMADLHLGRTLGGFSLLEEQKDMLDQMVQAASAESVDAVVLSGDIYDRAVPPAEATVLLDGFLSALSDRGIPVLAIAGNHDSAVRLQFAEEILAKQNIYIAGTLPQDHRLKSVTMQDMYGPVDFVFLPYFHPAEADASSSQEAVVKILTENGYLEADAAVPAAPPVSAETAAAREAQISAASSHRRVLITHFFVTDSGRPIRLSDSEEAYFVGNIDNVDAAVFTGFDYTALGHIHTMQQIGNTACWYAGSMMKYDFADSDSGRGALLVELGEPGTAPVVTPLPKKPLRDLRKIRGELTELLRPDVVSLADPDDYLQAVLTDRDMPFEPMTQLRRVYPHTVQVISEAVRKQASGIGGTENGNAGSENRSRTPMQFFEDFCRMVTGEELTEEERELAEELMPDGGAQ